MFARAPIALGWLLIASAAQACTIPVFRFALDRWEADRYRLVLPPEQAREAATRDLLRPLRANSPANLDIATAATSSGQPELRSAAEDRALWSGRLEAASLAGLLDSPGRRQIVERLLKGDSVVWVLAAGPAAEDRTRAGQIERRLKFLEQVASLPLQDPNDPDSQLGPGPPLRLKFTALPLRLDDPGEALLLRMLAGSRSRFDPLATGFGAAVFGRGRVLGAWPLSELDDQALEDACLFLTGRCSCRVKQDNPGWDLLLSVDWPRALNAAALTSDSTPSAPTPVAVPAAPATVVASPSPAPAPKPARSGTLAAFGASAVLLAAALRLLRPRRPTS